MFDAFMSYSHAADGILAPALQSGVQRFAKRWYRLRATRVFRDKTGLSLSPELWSSIETALAESRWFILLASPESAVSGWVQSEVEFWIKNKPPKNFVIVLTGGELEYDPHTGTINWTLTNALPRCLEPVLTSIPLYLDLRWVRSEEHIATRNPKFRDAIAEIAAPLRDVPKDQLIGEDVRLHRNSLRTAWSGVATLILLATVAMWLAFVANTRRQIADQQRALAVERGRLALSRQLASESLSAIDSDPTVAFRLAEDAVHVRPTIQAQIALFRTFDRRVCFSAATIYGDSAVADATVSPDGKQMLITSRYHVDVVSATTGELLKRVADNEYAHAFFSHDGSRILTVGSGVADYLQVWNVQSWQKENAWTYGEIPPDVAAQFKMLTGSSLNDLGDKPQFSPDGNRRIVIDHGVVTLLEASSGREICRMVGHQNNITSVRFSPDGKQLITASLDQTARLWRLPSLQRRSDIRPTNTSTFRSDHSGVTDTHTGIQAVIDGSTVNLVDANGHTLRRLVGHTSDIETIIFSPDGSQVATTCLVSASMGQQDTSVRVWDVNSGIQLRQFVGEVPNAVAFSSDGRNIIVNGTEWPAIWQEVLGAVKENARGVPRELTREEKELLGDHPDELR